MTARAAMVVALAIGVVGAAALAIGATVAPEQAAFAYLTAWTYAVSIALGGLLFLMIGHATGARWLIVFRRFTEGVARTLPILALGFIPIVIAMPLLYPWVEPSPALGHDVLAKLAHAAPYDNVPFFCIRGIACFALWIAVAELLVRWTATATARPATAGRVRALATGALPAVALTLTFAAFDWLMALTPSWYSTIFGLLYFSGGFVAALALIAVIARLARRAPAVAAAIGPGPTGALGRLVLAFVAFWAYMEFSQGIIIWIANKPGEVPWYVARGAGAWGGVFAVLVVGHFALPFFALLSRPLKRRPTLLAIVGAWLIAMHYVDIYWLVMPILHATFALHWLDLAAPCAVLGLTTAFAIARARRRSPVPDDDARLPAAVAYEQA